MPDPTTQENQPQEKDATSNPPGERREGGQASEKPGPGEPPPGLKDKDAETSDSYGNTRDSGDPASR